MLISPSPLANWVFDVKLRESIYKIFTIAYCIIESKPLTYTSLMKGEGDDESTNEDIDNDMWAKWDEIVLVSSDGTRT